MPEMPAAEGPVGGLDLGGLLSQVGDMQRSLQEAQEAVASQLVEGSAGGGAVRVRVTGGLEFDSVHVSPDVVDPDDVDILQDLLLAAIRDAVERAQELQRRVLTESGPLGGMTGLAQYLGGDPPEESE
jgi:nucleoid-associated protein EbfC